MEDNSPSTKPIESREAFERRLQDVVTAAEAGDLDVRGAYKCTGEDSIYDVEVTLVVPPRQQ